VAGDFLFSSDYTFIKNALAISGWVVVIYLLLVSKNNNILYNQIQGHWVNIECFSIEYTFTERQYAVNGVEMGTFGIKGNILTLSCGNTLTVWIRNSHSYMTLDGVQYLRRTEK